MNRKSMVLISLIVMFLGVSNVVVSDIIFFDDFDKETIGEEPSKWIKLTDVGGGEVTTDPAKSSNKVFRSPKDLHHGGGAYLIGEKTWVDYEIMWDWYLVDVIKEGIGGLNNISLIFRCRSKGIFLLCDTATGQDGIEERGDTTEISFRVYNFGRGGAEGDVVNWPLKDEVWYRMYLVVDGDTFTLKLKERRDPTSFDELEPIITLEYTAMVLKGRIGTWGVAYWDNVVVGEVGTGPEDLEFSVNPAGNLSTTWGILKKAY